MTKTEARKLKESIIRLVMDAVIANESGSSLFDRLSARDAYTRNLENIDRMIDAHTDNGDSNA